MSPVTPEARLTPLPTPLVKVRPSMSAVPPVKETPVPTSVNSLTVKMRSPLDCIPPLKSVNEASEISALPLTLIPSLSMCRKDASLIVAVPATSIPIRQSSINKLVAVKVPSTMIQDFALEIVTSFKSATPNEVMVNASQTPALCEPGLVV